jgi:7,8-dihydropterin-6-yl-methyl-4-(beta-D-ribofuranosyl)aminobenzene 5'-phosphate synthase
MAVPNLQDRKEMTPAMMKITIVYDNEAMKEGCGADWGFACMVEVEGGEKLLFDTGAKGSLLIDNLQKLGFDPYTLSRIFISHPHWDHTGGLSALLKINKKGTVYIPSSCPLPAGAAQVVSVEGPCQIQENVFSTGELQNMEQSLVVKSKEGLVLVTGCSHPGVRSILKAASVFGKPYALVGGLHGFREMELLEDLNLVCPCHCTQYKAEIKGSHPEKFTECGVGKIIEI